MLSSFNTQNIVILILIIKRVYKYFENTIDIMKNIVFGLDVLQSHKETIKFMTAILSQFRFILKSAF